MVVTSTPSTIVDHVVRAMTELILSSAHDFCPGDKLRIAKLVELFHVSPTPIKEALRQLHAEGLVVIEPRRGASVATMSTSDFEELFRLRIEFELVALKLSDGHFDAALVNQMERLLDEMRDAVEHVRIVEYHLLDCRFHALIVDLGSNSRLSSIHDNLLVQYRIRPAYMAKSLDSMRQSLREHEVIMEAIRAEDIPSLESLLPEHWRRARIRASSGHSIEDIGATGPEDSGGKRHAGNG